jgi:uncharacterized membrane protein required for colicin V production
MNGLDIVLSICLIISFFIGWKLRALHLLGFVVSLAVAIFCANHLSAHFVDYFRDMSEAARHTFAWIAVFVFFVVVILLFFSIAFKNFETSSWQWLDHLLGACIGIAIMFCILASALTMLNFWAPKHYSRMTRSSILTKPLLRYAQPCLIKISQKLPQLKQAIPE